MRRAARIDANQPDLVDYMRKRGAVVDIVSSLGSLGYDVTVWFMGRGRACEIKDPSKPPSDRKLTDNEVKAKNRLGNIYVVLETKQDCDNMLDEMRGVAS